MRAETRHRLKEDRFSRATIGAAEATVHWTEEHKSKLIIGTLILAVVLAAAFGGWYYLNQQDEKASLLLNQGVRTMDTQLRPAGTPAEPDLPTFASAQERTTEAHKQFQGIVDQYPHTRTAEFARYFLGLTSSQLGDNASGERDLKTVVSTRNEDLAALAKLALAAVYRDTNRTKEAIDLYNQLIANRRAVWARRRRRWNWRNCIHPRSSPPKPNACTSRSRRKIPPAKWRKSRLRNCSR